MSVREGTASISIRVSLSLPCWAPAWLIHVGRSRTPATSHEPRLSPGEAARHYFLKNQDSR